ncbi:crotonobetainyl-CoA--carnitine CoA-transferase [Aeromonas diversa]|uniref:crotonobetainyl-CoA--carnitine CoA-transferase n=1 Tax=Aeromonas diversa TaxID=502790 RepID=UPI0034637E3D
MNAQSYASETEIAQRRQVEELLAHTPLPSAELMNNLGLYLRRQSLSRILFMHELYQHILPVHGVIMDLGTRWGHNMALFGSFRGMYEPYNYNRKIIGFDTFNGFPHHTPEDGQDAAITLGAYSVTEGYEEHLSALLLSHEAQSPLPHLVKHELIKGDVCITVPDYLAQHPETIVALAYFDFDLYAPTKACLEALRPHLTKGSVLAFDELNWPGFPGETLALKEVLGLDRYAIRRTPHNPGPSYLVIE